MSTPTNPSSSLQSAMNWSGFALTIAPAVLELAVTLQRLFGKGKGKQKSAVMQSVIKSAVPSADPAVVQSVTDASVAALKEAGHPAFV